MSTAAAAPPPPPPPPPPPAPCTNQSSRISSPPCPGHAAIPYFSSPPVQETSPSLETLHEDAPATPPLPLENGPQFLPSEGQENNPSDSGEKYSPVQETNPAPQALNGPQVTDHQDEAAKQMDQAGEDQLP